MDVILMERIRHLGQMGDVVNVKPGYARNYLLPQGKALRASKANLEYFETQRKELEARNLKERQEAEAAAKTLEGAKIMLIRQAGEAGQLYGSVSSRDIASALTQEGYNVDRKQVVLDRPIKTLGLHEILVHLHPEVEVSVSVNVARSEEEAEVQRAEMEAAAAPEAVEEMFETKELAERAEEEISEELEAAEDETAEETSEPGEAGEEEV